MRFDGRVAIVTGAGGGLGREYALLFASRGAAVVVNDLGGARDGQGNSTSAADKVVNEIRSAGGRAVANYDSVENGEAIVKTAIDNFGRIDIVVNNAGILRDKSFAKMTEQDWDLVHRVHLRGSFLVTKAAWPYFRQQQYGRIIMTSSTAGLYGNFGQANYSAAKLGLLGLSNTLAIEGAKYNIHCNTIVPVAASRLTEDILPPNILEKLKPVCVAPVVVYLCHESCQDNGGIFEAAGGWVGKYRLQRSQGKVFIPITDLTPEGVQDSWQQITDMSRTSYPTSTQDQFNQLIGAISGDVPPTTASSSDLQNQEEHLPPSNRNGVFPYTVDDVILYAIAVGMSTREKDHLRFLYECNDKFQVLPTYGVIPSMQAIFDFGIIQKTMRDMKIKWDPARLLHGEQYLELRNPIPSTGTLISTPRIMDVLDKGVGALVICEVETKDTEGRPIMYNQFALMLIGSGKFGGKRTSENETIVNVVEPPKRPPDASISEQTSVDQAALYRLCGDKNPLHIDPTFAAVGGFQQPILHGLCSLGYATRHILKTFADNDVRRFKSVKARFAGPILPGQTIQTDMWQEGNRIYFQSVVRETGKPIITGSYVDLVPVVQEVTAPGDPAHVAASTEDDDVFFLSDVVFDEIGRRVELAPELSTEVNAVFEFDIIKEDKIARSWILDLRNVPASLYQGKYKEGEPNCLIEITDEDMVELGMGNLDPVRGFMNGRIKIKGNPLLTQKLQKLLEIDSSDHIEGVVKNHELANLDVEATSAANDTFTRTVYEVVPSHSQGPNSSDSGHQLSSGQSSEIKMQMAPPSSDHGSDSKMLASADGGGGSGDGGNDTGCRIDKIFDGWLRTRLRESNELVPHIKTVYQWNVTKDGKIKSVWTLDVKNPPGDVYRGAPKTGRPDCTLTIDDDYAVEVFEGREDAMRAFMTGKLKITGNILAAQKLQQLWAEEQVHRPGLAQDSLPTPTKSKPQPAAAPQATSAEDKALFDSIPTSGLKSDIVFNVFKNRMHEEPELVRRLRVIFQFNITKNGEQKAIWTADNKSTEGGDVFPGPPKDGIKPDCVVTVDDDDFLKLMVGKLNPQRAFMMGKLKIKGNIMLLQKLNSLWIEFQKSGKAPEIPILSDIMLKENVIPGLRSEAMVVELVQRMARMPQLPSQFPGYLTLQVTKDGKPTTKYTIDLRNKPIGFAYRGDPQGGASPDCTLTMEDDDMVRLTFHKLRLADVISSGRVKCDGDRSYAEKLDVVFSTPTTKPRL